MERVRGDGRPAGWRDEPIYLDYNATTPVDARVAEAARPYWERWFGNPSSDHAYGRPPRRAVTRARGQVAALIGFSPDDIVFTGSGSEADQLAIRGPILGVMSAGRAGRPRIVTQVTEHPAVLAGCEAMARWHDAEVIYLPVDRHGLVDPDSVAGALASAPGSGPVPAGPAVVSVMLANNETGAVQPVREIAAAAHGQGAVLHVDAAQAVGKIGVDVADLGADLLTVVGHKMYAPKGIAALYVRPGLTLEPVIYGGGQERGRRRSPARQAAGSPARPPGRSPARPGQAQRPAGRAAADDTQHQHRRRTRPRPARRDPGDRRVDRVRLPQRPAHALARADRHGPERRTGPGLSAAVRRPVDHRSRHRRRRRPSRRSRHPPDQASQAPHHGLPQAHHNPGAAHTMISQAG